LSPKTVANYVSNILHKLQVADREEAALAAGCAPPPLLAFFLLLLLLLLPVEARRILLAPRLIPNLW
jgi:hypothetical protein